MAIFGLDTAALAALGTAAAGVGSIASAGLGAAGAAQANSARSAQSWQQMQFQDYERLQEQAFNTEAAWDARRFNADEAEKARWFNAYQSLYARDWASQEASSARQWTGEQAEIARQYNTGVIGRQEAFQKLMAQEAMGFSERMSNTAWQRSVDDMRRAGINPILAYSKGGASSPPGISASGSALASPSPSASIPSASAASGGAASAAAAQGVGLPQGSKADVENIFGSLLNTGQRVGEGMTELAKFTAGLERMRAEINKSNAETRRTDAETLSELKRPKLIDEQTGNIAADTILKGIYKDVGRSQTAKNIAEADQAHAGAGLANVRSIYEPKEAGGRTENAWQQAHTAAALERLYREADPELKKSEAFRNWMLGAASLVGGSKNLVDMLRGGARPGLPRGSVGAPDLQSKWFDQPNLGLSQ